jgi:hypothetical protein
MSIRKLISKISALKQNVLITITASEVKAENLETGLTHSMLRKSSHPRTLAGDFYKMEMEFKEVLSKVLIRKWIQPQLVVSLSGCSEGGYTNIENRAFLEAAYGASNAINVIISDKVISTKQAIELLSA